MVLIILAEFTAKEGKLDQVLDHLQILTRYAEEKEPGVSIYMPTQDEKDKHKITIWEQYDTEDAFNNHIKQEPFRNFSGSAEELIEGGIKGVKLTRLSKLEIQRPKSSL